MSNFEGDLLIGGMTLHRLHGELESQAHEEQSGDWLLAGRLELTPGDIEYLQVGRRYRLQLTDGRAGQVIIARVEPSEDSYVLAEFHPHSALNKPR